MVFFWGGGCFIESCGGWNYGDTVDGPLRNPVITSSVGDFP